MIGVIFFNVYNHPAWLFEWPNGELFSSNIIILAINVVSGFSSKWWCQMSKKKMFEFNNIGILRSQIWGVNMEI